MNKQDIIITLIICTMLCVVMGLVTNCAQSTGGVIRNNPLDTQVVPK